MMHETCNKQQAVGKAFGVGVSSDSKQLNTPRIRQPTEPLPRFTRLLSAVLLPLIVACTFTLLGCSDDDDQETVSLADVEVSNAASVFDVLENRSFPFTASGGGIFGVTEGRMEFGAVTLDANGVPRAPFRLVDEVNVDTHGVELSAEGRSDGEASCNFLFATSDFAAGQGPQVGQLIECKTCAFLVSATDVPVSGNGPGMLTWVLAIPPNAINDPAFTSVALNVTVGVDAEGNLVSINNQPVTPDN
jgi:hypothetical protein